MWTGLKMLKSTGSTLVKFPALAASAYTDLTRKLLQEDECNEDSFASVDEEDEGGLEQNEPAIYSLLGHFG